MVGETMSPFVQRIFLSKAQGFIARYSSSLSTLLILTAIFIVTVLDIAGYRYGAQRLARSYTLSLGTLMLLPLLYTAVLSMLNAFSPAQRNADTGNGSGRRSGCGK